MLLAFCDEAASCAQTSPRKTLPEQPIDADDDLAELQLGVIPSGILVITVPQRLPFLLDFAHPRRIPVYDRSIQILVYGCSILIPSAALHCRHYDQDQRGSEKAVLPDKPSHGLAQREIAYTGSGSNASRRVFAIALVVSM